MISYYSECVHIQRLGIQKGIQPRCLYECILFHGILSRDGIAGHMTRPHLQIQFGEIGEVADALEAVQMIVLKV